MTDSPIILTLDAGGTNFVFSAMRNGKEIIGPITLPAYAHDLDLCTSSLISGFENVINKLGRLPQAISFAFPGPANYPLGIIENLPNFKAFNGGIALGPMLEDHFGIPVFINNDGDLYAYGEALAGMLPYINQKLKEGGSPKQFKNLLGITIGTGFGAGIVIDGVLLNGDNSCGAGIHGSLNPYLTDWNAEESVSTRAIQRVYVEASGTVYNAELMPGDIYKIAKNEIEGNTAAALQAFREFGAALGLSIANAITLIDGLVVIGGGIAAGWDLFAPAMFKALKKEVYDFRGAKMDRLSVEVYDLEEAEEMNSFIAGNPQEIKVPGSNRTVSYDSCARIGVAKSKLGASKAISLGSYTYALAQLAV